MNRGVYFDAKIIIHTDSSIRKGGEQAQMQTTAEILHNYRTTIENNSLFNILNNNSNELWLEISGYKNYAVSNLGNVINLRTCKLKEPSVNKMGYYYISLWSGKENKFAIVHRLVATAFIDKPLGKDTVNHKDGNRKNNKAENLEWVTNSENIKHSYNRLGVANRGRKKLKPSGAKFSRVDFLLDKYSQFIDDNYRAYFARRFHKISEAAITNAAEQASKARKPKSYFGTVIRLEYEKAITA